MKLKVFDVVELKNNEKATILRVTDNMCLVDIAGEQKRHKVIDVSEIKDVIFRK